MFALRPLHCVALVGIMFIWGMNFAVTKTAVQHAPPILLVALRWSVTALCLLPFVRIPRRAWRELFPVALTFGVLHFCLIFTAMRSVDASTAAIIVQIQVPFAAILSLFFLGERFGWRSILGMVVAFAGVAVIAGTPRLDGQYVGFFLVIAASFCFALFNVLAKRLRDLDGWQINAGVAAMSTPLLFPISYLLEEGQWAFLANPESLVIVSAATFYQSVVVVLLGYGLWYWLLRINELNQVMIFTLLAPVFGVISGVVFLDEPLSLGLFIGGILTVTGIAIVIIRRPKVAAPEAELASQENSAEQASEPIGEKT